MVLVFMQLTRDLFAIGKFLLRYAADISINHNLTAQIAAVQFKQMREFRVLHCCNYRWKKQQKFKTYNQLVLITRLNNFSETSEE